MGLAAIAVDVEVRCGNAKKGFTLIGLGDTAVKEARERVQSALRLAGFRMPREVLVNLAPAGLRKEGSSFDLAIALGILVASGQVQSRDWRHIVVHGELALDGRIKAVRGVIALTIDAVQQGAALIIVPQANQAEAALVSGIKVVGVDSLRQLIAYLNGEPIPATPQPVFKASSYEAVPLFSEVVGQETAKKALLIAAAGGHNVLLVGPPGCGKTMLASAFRRLIPPLTQAEMLEAVKIYSIAGMPFDQLIAGERPFRNPHHAVSAAGMVGGGTYPRPGEISLAHQGVLFLDEFPEFKRGALEALRAPLEEGRITVARAKQSVAFPAQFQLVAAMNPCPCGRYGMTEPPCVCSPGTMQAYLRKLSEPILDRIDLHVDLDAVPISQLARPGCVDRSVDDCLRSKVIAAREFSQQRQGCLNSRLNNAMIAEYLNPEAEAVRLIERLAEKALLSARGYYRMLKTARTIADLRESSTVSRDDVAEAATYRSLERLKRCCGAADN